MPEENQTVDNQTAPDANVGTQTVQSTTEQAGQQQQTSGETNTEFNEQWTPEMQAVWTKKSTELKQGLEKERGEFAKEREALQKKAEIYDRLDRDPRAIEALKKLYAQQEEAEPAIQIPQITKEDIELAQSDPEAQVKLLEKMEQRSEAKLKTLENRLNKTSDELAHTRLVSAISEFAREAPGWDDIEDAGLIKPMLQEYRTNYPNATEIQVVEAAYRSAKKVWDNMSAKLEEKHKAAAQKVISEKKIASGDTGQASNVPLKPIEGKNWREVFNKGADEIGFK